MPEKRKQENLDEPLPFAKKGGMSTVARETLNKHV